jgi:glycosyltransferase involved in cell wall biosynthesis
MSAPLVSVVIPAYNAARTLEATVASALAQTVQDLEIVIVNDGSRDDTLAVARSLSDPRIHVVDQPNGGAAAARNTGLQAASGRYVALLDADDLWLPDKLERQLRVLETELEVQAVQCGAYFVNDAMEVISVQPCTDTGRSFEETLLFRNLPAFLSALVVRRDRILEVGGFDTDLEILEEWDMAIKMSRYCAMRSVCDPLVLYRVHAGNRHWNVDIHIRPGLKVLEGLFVDPSLPPEIRRLRRRAYGTFYRTLAGGYFNQRNLTAFLRWSAAALATDPSQALYMAALPLRRLRRRPRHALKFNPPAHA